MNRFEKLELELKSKLDSLNVEAAFQSMQEMLQRFVIGDWKPAELDGGRLCESIARLFLQLDTSRVDHKLLPGRIREILSDDNLVHALGKKDRQHLASVIGVTYKFRSDRGAVHVSTVHTANQVDSMMVVSNCRWLFAELLRLGASKQPSEIGEAISELGQMPQSLIHEKDGIPLVLVGGLTAAEEVLLLLNHSASNTLMLSELQKQTPHHKPTAISTAVSRLLTSRELRRGANREISLTPVGQARVLNKIIPRL